MSVAFKLYELSDHISQIQYMLENGEEGLEDTLESLEVSFEEKAESIIKLWRSKMAEAEAIKSEEMRLSERRKRVEKNAEWLRGYVEREMIRANRTEVKSALFKIGLRYTPARVEVLDAKVIPDAYIRVNITQSPDKVAIKDAIQRGEDVPGCEIRQDLKLQIS